VRLSSLRGQLVVLYFYPKADTRATVSSIDGRDVNPRPLDRAVYQGLASYAFGEPICWPSQVRIARELGISQPTVSRSIARLVAAGWIEIIERRPARVEPFTHNVYALLAPWKPVAAWVRDRIVERARAAHLFAVNTNLKGSRAFRPRNVAAVPLAPVVASARGASP
jgi:hypothetical protein